MQNTTSHKLKNEDALAFLLGGRARFTLKSLETSVDFSFEIKNQKVKQGNKKVDNPNLKFVFLFIGAGTQVRGSEYGYFGYIVKTRNGWEYRDSPKSAFSNNLERGIVGFKFVFQKLLNGAALPKLEIWHQGICACCGRALKLSESIELGWGPVCLGRRVELRAQLEREVETRRVEANKVANAPRIFSKNATLQTNLFNSQPDLVTVKR